MVLTDEQKKANKKIHSKKYRDDNKERIKVWSKKYRDDNKERINKKGKEYRKTPQHIKSVRISKWKCSGVKCEYIDLLYEKYINTINCELCEVELTEDKITTKTTKCLDHDHYTGLFRNVLCWYCNINLPKQNKDLISLQ